jgi:solute carrier family 25 (mitochondrial oxoglutarate transporter), member 11
MSIGIQRSHRISIYEAIETCAKFGLAGISGASGWLFVHPFDVAKVQMQIKQQPGATLTSTCRNMLASNGVAGLYARLNFAMWRQLTYTMSRMGLYDVIMPMFEGSDGKVSALDKMAAGFTAGGIAPTACCPVEVGLVWAQADSSLPPAERRNYTGLFDAIRQIKSTEGVRPLARRGSDCGPRCSGQHDPASQLRRPKRCCSQSWEMGFHSSWLLLWRVA